MAQITDMTWVQLPGVLNN